MLSYKQLDKLAVDKKSLVRGLFDLLPFLLLLVVLLVSLESI